MDEGLEECTRCGKQLYHLRHGICAWCECELRGCGGSVEYRNYTANVGEETPASATALALRLSRVPRS
jgi:ribosomal protein L37E